MEQFNSSIILGDSIKMKTMLVLATSNFAKPFTLECDSSSTRIKAVLMQEGRPILFERNKLNECQRRLSISNKEMLAIMHTLANGTISIWW